jgi:hypothetical protein
MNPRLIVLPPISLKAKVKPDLLLSVTLIIALHHAVSYDSIPSLFSSLDSPKSAY